MRSQIIIPPKHVAAMKSTLNIPWSMMKNISRWLGTFHVKLSSEKTSREVGKQWVGLGLNSELAPLAVRIPGTKTVTISLKPWAYLYNVVGHVLKRLNELEENGLIFDHPFISPDEIHVKVGGDHGDTSFKFSYQIANVRHPNSKENTVVFTLFEAKDTRSNLRTCLSRFAAQIDMLQRTKWKGKSIRVFMFGDYEFLCAMYGLSGPNGKT